MASYYSGFIEVFQEPEFYKLVKMIEKAKKKLIRQGYNNDQIQDILFVKMFGGGGGGGNTAEKPFKRLDDTNEFYNLKSFISDQKQIELILQFYNSLVYQKNQYQCGLNDYYDLLSYKLNLGSSNSGSPEISSSPFGSDEDSEYIKINSVIKRELLSNTGFRQNLEKQNGSFKHTMAKKRKGKIQQTYLEENYFQNLEKRAKLDCSSIPDPDTGCLWSSSPIELNFTEQIISQSKQFEYPPQQTQQIQEFPGDQPIRPSSKVIKRSLSNLLDSNPLEEDYLHTQKKVKKNEYLCE